MGYFDYDVIVVGGGHAGAEAAAVAARMGARTMLITMNLQSIGQMSCNPAIGGIGKGHIVREIDALGGIMGLVTDETGIQFRMLNQRKGPAVWGPRAQCDRMAYKDAVRNKLESIANLFMRANMVVDIMERDGKVTGVRTQTGQEFYAPAVILSGGTFLNGTIHIGECTYGGGRFGDRAAVGLTAGLEKLGFKSERLKTGTPPRVDRRSIDLSVMEEQAGDPDASPFSFMTDSLPSEQQSCYLVYTHPGVHDTLRTGFDRSPLFAGRIQGRGPRYCPSIEDKIDRFSGKDRHQLFLEPEGKETYEMYVNGFSTSLPEDVQFAALRLVPGMKNVHMIRPGYAIEYDYFPPYQVRYSLETKRIKGLYFAGQINGSTGYEEAAAQGLMAGINAVRQLSEQPPVILKRTEAYIAVLIDDLVAKGTDEPYRMFTSRAEHRILLRQDNADLRLTQKGYELGTVSDLRYQRMRKKLAALDEMRRIVETTTVSPEQVNGYLEQAGTSPIQQPERLIKLALRPQVSLEKLLEITGFMDTDLPRAPGMESAERLLEIELRYDGYLEREYEMVKKMERMESWQIPKNFQYQTIENITFEAREKLSKIQPDNLGQASRISGVSPADISVLMVLLKKNGKE